MKTTTTAETKNHKEKGSIQDLDLLFQEYKKREAVAQGLNKQIEERMKSTGLV